MLFRPCPWNGLAQWPPRGCVWSRLLQDLSWEDNFQTVSDDLYYLRCTEVKLCRKYQWAFVFFYINLSTQTDIKIGKNQTCITNSKHPQNTIVAHPHMRTKGRAKGPQQQKIRTNNKKTYPKQELNSIQIIHHDTPPPWRKCGADFARLQPNCEKREYARSHHNWKSKEKKKKEKSCG